MNKLNINLGKLKLKNPILPASGTFGSGKEFSEYFDINILGGIVTKSITLLPREGNSQPRIYEIYGGLLNSIGLQNGGLDKFAKDEIPFIEKLDTIKIVSISGKDTEEYSKLAYNLDKQPIDAIEVNLSCPNIKGSNQLFCYSSSLVEEIIRNVKQNTKKIIIAKLSIEQNNIKDIAKAAELSGADALCVGNTIKGLAIDIKKMKPVFKNIFAGQSGPSIKHIALRAVWDTYTSVKIPIIGCGGIMNYSDVLEFIMAGASAVELGSANFVDPEIMPKIINSINEYCEKNNIFIKDIIGIAHKLEVNNEL
jgi:dihydroorotate dehydrogenase (NAD+) catalytic subunit